MPFGHLNIIPIKPLKFQLKTISLCYNIADISVWSVYSYTSCDYHLNALSLTSRQNRGSVEVAVVVVYVAAAVVLAAHIVFW